MNNSATGVPRQFYRHFAGWIVGQGYSVVTYDYRGIGGSIPTSIAEVEGSIRDWGERDAAGVTDWCLEEAGEAAIGVIGHSIGGQLIGLCDNSTAYAAMVCVAAQSGYWGLWPTERSAQRRALWERVPALVAEHGYFPGSAHGLADLPPTIATSWARWCLSPDYIVDDAGEPLRTHFKAIHQSMRFFAFADDDIAPLAAVEALMGFYANAPRTLDLIAPAQVALADIGHFEAFRPSHNVLWPRLLAPFASVGF